MYSNDLLQETEIFFDSENFKLRFFFSLSLFLKGLISQKAYGRKDKGYGCWSFCLTYC